jgi:hypothetical protein
MRIENTWNDARRGRSANWHRGCNAASHRDAEPTLDRIALPFGVRVTHAFLEART